MKICDTDIDGVAEELPDWQSVADKLGFESQYITDIETNHRDQASQRKAFLRMWIGRDGSAATYNKLCDALILLNLKGAAERINNIGNYELRALAVGEVALADELELKHMKSTQQGKMLCMSPQTGSKIIPVIVLYILL